MKENECKGWLWRYTGYLSGWIKRYYRIDINSMCMAYYYKETYNFPAGFIPIDSLFSVSMNKKQGYEREFVVSCRKGKIRMMAYTIEEAKKWVKMITNIIIAYRPRIKINHRPRTPPTPEYLKRTLFKNLNQQMNQMSVLQTAFFRYFYSPKLKDDKSDVDILNLLLRMMIHCLSDPSELSLDALFILMERTNGTTNNMISSSSSSSSILEVHNTKRIKKSQSVAESQRISKAHLKLSFTILGLNSALNSIDLEQAIVTIRSPKFRRRASSLANTGNSLESSTSSSNYWNRPHSIGRKYKIPEHLKIVRQQSSPLPSIKHSESLPTCINSVESDIDVIEQIKESHDLSNATPIDLMTKIRKNEEFLPKLDSPSITTTNTAYRTLHRKSCPPDILRTELTHVHKTRCKHRRHSSPSISIDELMIDDWLTESRHNELLLVQWCLSDQGLQSILLLVDDRNIDDRARSLGIIVLYVIAQLHARLHTRRCLSMGKNTNYCNTDMLLNGKCINNNICVSCNKASILFDNLIDQCCSGKNASFVTVRSLIYLLITPLIELLFHSEIDVHELQQQHRVANWTVWSALLSSMKGCDFHTRRRTLKDLSSMLLFGAGIDATYHNCQTLANLSGWQNNILDLLIDVPKEAAIRTFNDDILLNENKYDIISYTDEQTISRIVERVYHYSVNMFTIVHFTSFLSASESNQPSSFIKLFQQSMIACNQSSEHNDDMFMINSLITAFILKLTAKKSIFPSSFDSTMWKILILFLNMLKTLLFGNETSIKRKCNIVNNEECNNLLWSFNHPTIRKTLSQRMLTSIDTTIEISTRLRAQSAMVPSEHLNKKHYHHYKHANQLKNELNNNNKNNNNNNNTSNRSSLFVGYVTRSALQNFDQKDNVKQFSDDLILLDGPHWEYNNVSACLERDMLLCRRIIMLLDALQFTRQRSSLTTQYYDEKEKVVYKELDALSGFFRDGLVFLKFIKEHGWRLPLIKVYELLHKFITASPQIRHKVFNNTV